jgi:pimeloyl-ACP methyl ester carboxylesterase
MRKLVTTVAAVGTLGLGLAATSATAEAATGSAVRSATSASTNSYTPPPIDWGTCPTASLRNAGATCGMLTVPLDYAAPGGAKIQLAVSKIAHKTSDADAQGIMLVNPGGPGGSGLGLSRLGEFVPNHGGDPYDWIGFDPRGVRRSIPSLTCDGDYFATNRPYYVPETDQLREAWWDKTRQYAQDCKAAGGALLDHMKTTDWVEDMESIRKALGAEQINYYGFSYGTYLGQVYSTLHPDRVRRMVWDGVVNPVDVWYDANLNQDVQFDKNIKVYFDWIAKHDDAYHLGTDGAAIEDLYYSIQQDLRAHPADGLGPSEWNDIFVSAAYYVYGWEDVAHVLVAAAHGDFQPARDYYGNPTGPGADNTYANYLAVECTDAQWPQGWGTWSKDNWSLHEQYPFLTWNNAWYNAPCRYWPAKAGVPTNVGSSTVPGILLIEETNDAATPWAGAIEVRKRYPNAVLIEGVGGTTHAGSLSGVACTDDRIADYLLTGALPTRLSGDRSDVQCDPVPQPEPAPTPGFAAGSTTGTGSTVQDRLSPDLRKLIARAERG